MRHAAKRPPVSCSPIRPVSMAHGISKSQPNSTFICAPVLEATTTWAPSRALPNQRPWLHVTHSSKCRCYYGSRDEVVQLSQRNVLPCLSPDAHWSASVRSECPPPRASHGPLASSLQPRFICICVRLQSSPALLAQLFSPTRARCWAPTSSKEP